MKNQTESKLRYAMFGGFIESSLEIQHSNCLMMELSDRLGVTIEAHLPLTAMAERTIEAMFAVPRALSEEEVMKVFEGKSENLTKAVINVDEGEDLTVFIVSYKDPAIEWLINTPGLILQTYQATPNQEKVSLWSSNVDTIDIIRDGLNKIGKASLVGMKRVERNEMVKSELLSPSQYKVLIALLQQGFWSLPKKGTTLEEIAPKLGMSKSTLSLLVREIAGKIFEDYTKKIARLR